MDYSTDLMTKGNQSVENSVLLMAAVMVFVLVKIKVAELD